MDALANKFKVVSKSTTVSATANLGFTASLDFSESGYSMFAIRRIQTNQGAYTKLCSFWIEDDVGKAYYAAGSTATVTVYMEAIMMKN